MNDSSRIALPRGSRPQPAGATHVGRSRPEDRIRVSVILARRRPLDLAALGGRQLSHQEFEQQYAADPAVYEQLCSFAGSHGLTIDRQASSPARRTVVLEGPVSAMEAAFGVELHDWTAPDPAARDPRAAPACRFHAYSGEPSLAPDLRELAPHIQAVLGLDARPVARPHYRTLAGLRRPRAAAASFTPVQVAEAYNFPRNLTGAGQCIAMIELGGGYRESDLGSYFQSIGLKAPAVAAIGVDGGSNNPADTSGANGEVALDIEVAGAVASGAKIAVYFAPNTDAGFLDALTTAVHDRTNQPAVVSISWGGPESGWSQQALQAFDDACRSAASLGVTVCAASGDSGSSDGGSGDNVDFPASSPHVLACGGTALKAAGARRQSETVWNDQAQGGGATGGGVSTAFPVPAWQQGLSGLPAAKGGGGRGVPDVAGDASPETGYQVFFDGQSQVLGGTSAVAPLWAALLALANQQLAEARAGRRVGLAQPALYKAGNAFFDVTEGSNGDFSAGPGWDPCTGLGSPDGAAVIAALSA